jgi:DNA uptake protein ComE-like DNA-binding protein
MTVGSRRRSPSAGFVLLATLALLASLLALGRAPPRLGRPLACARAQLVEGELRCEGELLENLGDLCPALGPALGADLGAGVPLRPGDALAPAACVCAAHPALGELGLGCPRAGVVARMPPEQLAALGQIVELNTASPAELASLPGIGPKLAQRIVAGRPYARLEELAEVRGIGPKRLAAIRPRARVKPAPPPSQRGRSR